MSRTIPKKLQNTGLTAFMTFCFIVSVSIPLFIGLAQVSSHSTRNIIQTYGDTMFRLFSNVDLAVDVWEEDPDRAIKSILSATPDIPGSYYLFDPSGTIATSGCIDGPIFPLEHLPTDDNMNQKMFLHHNQYRGTLLYVFVPLQTGHRLVLIFPVHSLSLSVQDYISIVSASFLSALILLLFFICLLRRYYIQPIKILEATMKNPAMNTKIQSFASWCNEAGRMCAAYLDRHEEYQNSLEEINRLNIEQRTSEVEVLQNQINSHFIYNTLNNIQWLASANRSEDVVRTARSLDTLLRACAKNDSDYVTIENELTYVEAYLSSQKIRFNDTFDYEFQLDPLQMQMKIPKFIVQPIVENSIYHGFLDADRSNGHIQIRLYRQGYRIIIEVYDNGIGIPAENIYPILNNTQKSSDRYMGIAIGNINKRIRLLCGREFGLGIDSKVGQYTLVKIILPIIP